MKKTPIAVVLAATLAATAAIPLSARAGLPAYDSQGEELPTLAPMVERTMPAVVNIFTRTRVPVQQHPLYSDPMFRRFFNVPEQPRERLAQSLGSGVIVDAKNGYILTNHHVVGHADEISVTLSDGRSLKAELVGSDSEADVAVIKVPAENLAALPVADSDKLRVGDFVVAVGNPLGIGKSVTTGIVSALGRSGLGIESYEDFIQTDAAINRGNSGGPLVNLRGELVGINTAIMSQSGGSEGIGFAIPINMARDIMAQLVEHGEVRRGQLGAQAQDLTPELAQAFGLKPQQGAVVTQVSPNSPADKAGLEAGDVITKVNGRPVYDSADVRNIVGLLRIGQKVELDVLRDGKPKTIRAKIEEPTVTTIDGEKVHPHLSGAAVGNIVEGMELYGKVRGVVLLEVTPGSPAWRAGLRRGDVIAQANRREVKDLDSLRKAVKGSRDLLLNIQRKGGALFVVIR